MLVLTRGESFMRLTRLEYPSGREVLRDYWGFLSSGGLLLGERIEAVTVGTADGEAVTVDVHISSLRKQFRLAGHLRRTDDGRSLIVFERGQPQDLLNAAWADGEGVPERRHRRWEVPSRVEVRYRLSNDAGEGLLLNLSRGGCCLQLASPVRAGVPIQVRLAGEVIDGRVRWSRPSPCIVGIEFATFQEALVTSLITGHPSHAAPHL